MPSAGAYLNAALYYDFEPGRLYVVHTSPRFLTAITLRPGEKLISKAAGDTVRWVLGETVQGAGAGQQVIVFVKPIRGGLRTNIILTTDQRTYLLEAVSHEGETYTSVISWNYPQEEMRDAQAAREAADQAVVAGSILFVTSGGQDGGDLVEAVVEAAEKAEKNREAGEEARKISCGG